MITPETDDKTRTYSLPAQVRIAGDMEGNEREYRCCNYVRWNERQHSWIAGRFTSIDGSPSSFQRKFCDTFEEACRALDALCAEPYGEFPAITKKGTES